MGRIGIFLDRDGTINEEVDFLSSPKDLRLIPRSADAIREANGLDAVVCVVSNQSGVARGFVTEAQLSEIHAALRAELARHGAHLDAIYYCPHHPTLGDGPNRTECACRKPHPGMVHDAVREFGVDPTASFVIGDRMLDVQLANAVGATAILVRTGYGSTELAAPVLRPGRIDYVAQDLYDAVQFVKRMILHD
jgi:D-glycero-D-manno-heptose 1,7-bisphosphate phosphatase